MKKVWSNIPDNVVACRTSKKNRSKISYNYHGKENEGSSGNGERKLNLSDSELTMDLSDFIGYPT